MSAQLAGRVAWITGSSRGIGQAIAWQLARAGAAVAIHGSSAASSDVFGEGASLTDLAAQITAETGSPTAVVIGDLTNLDVAHTLTTEITDQLGPIDILVTAAGGDIGAAGVQGVNAGKITDGNDALFLPEADARAIWERNFTTCVHACQAVVPAMVRRRAGWVVTLGSISGLTGIPVSAIYASSKAAVHEYTRCLAKQVRDAGVHVNCVAPGDTRTKRFDASRELDAARLATDGLRRYGTPEEVAAVVEFLVSDAASYITGQVIRVDGGMQAFPG